MNHPGFVHTSPSWEGWRDAEQVRQQTRAKAVRLVQDHVVGYESEWAAMQAIAARLGTSAETVRHVGPPG